MLRMDLEAAGIPYRDASGLFFDFHSSEMPDRDPGRCRWSDRLGLFRR